MSFLQKKPKKNTVYHERYRTEANVINPVLTSTISKPSASMYFLVPSNDNTKKMVTPSLVGRSREYLSRHYMTMYSGSVGVGEKTQSF